MAFEDINPRDVHQFIAEVDRLHAPDPIAKRQQQREAERQPKTQKTKTNPNETGEGFLAGLLILG
jgi:hypothetical protein